MTTLAIIAALVTVLYAVSALIRIAPVKRRGINWKQFGGMSVTSLLVLALAACTYGLTRSGADTRSAQASPAADTQTSYPANTAAFDDTAASDAGFPIGVYAPGEWKSWSPVQQFSQQAGQSVHYVLDYMGPDEPFPALLGKLAAEHGAEPVLQLEPTMSMADIAAGKDDAYLHSLARQVTGYGHQVVLSFAPEANGSWYQYGWTRTPAADYQAAWKHVMAEFTGVRNVTWMDTINVSYEGSAPIADYIVPGVMIGIDGYYDFHNNNHSFDSVFGWTLAQVRANTKAPVMISETAIQGNDNQAGYIPDLVKQAKANHLAGLIWFNKDLGAIQHWPLTSSGAAALRAALRPSSIPVLLYHGIYGTSDPESNSVTLAAFRQQMAYLYKNGYRTISPQQYQLWTEGKPVELPAKPILITVDCNQTSFQQALPVLRQYHYRVVMYVVTGYADEGYKGPSGQPGYFDDWADLKAMYSAGYIYPQFHAGLCGHGYTMSSSPYGCDDGLTPTPGTIWGHRYYADPMGQSQAAYRARVEKDVEQGMADTEKEFGLTRADLSETFAVPFSDYGQPETTNQPWLGSYFAKQFSIVFVQNNDVPGKDNLFYRQEIDLPTTMPQFTASLHNKLFTVQPQ